MFVGSVGWLLEMANEFYNCRVTIFDCTSGEVVWNSDDYDGYNIPSEVDSQGFADYDVCSYDLYMHDNRICLEINIDMEEDD